MSISLTHVLLLATITTIQAQTNTCDEGDVRLLLNEAVNLRAGVVEICHNGTWGTICGESDTEPWAEKNAQVVCRQLGYSGALNSILQNTLPFSSRITDPVPVHYTDVSCLGSELTLTDCPLSEVGLSDNCPHLNDVAITCRSTTEDGDIRLAGDTADGHGAVQLFDVLFGWIDVCSDSTWGEDEANVVCRQLGYESGITRLYSIGSSIRTAFFFSCDDDEDDIINDCTYETQSGCPSNTRGGVECTSSSCTVALGILPRKQWWIWGVGCHGTLLCEILDPPLISRALGEGSVRLEGSDVTNEGRVEILYNGRWGTICDTSWDVTVGEAACNQLGFDYESVDTSYSGVYGDPSNVKPTWLIINSCSSNDLELSECDHGNPIGYTSCLSGDAELRCFVSEISDEGLSGGAIAGIVIGSLVFVGIVTFFIVRADQKKKQRARQSAAAPAPAPTPATTTTPAPAPTPAAPAAPESTPDTTTSAAEPTQSQYQESREDIDDPKLEKEKEFTKPPPPSFGAASSFPTAEPASAPPPTDLPPPYPGPTLNPYPPAPYPAVPYPYPPGPAFQGYPPPTNAAYPPTLDPAYPPTLDPAYPPTLGPAYPPPTAPDFQSTAPYPT